MLSGPGSVLTNVQSSDHWSVVLPCFGTLLWHIILHCGGDVTDEFSIKDLLFLLNDLLGLVVKKPKTFDIVWYDFVQDNQVSKHLETKLSSPYLVNKASFTCLYESSSNSKSFVVSLVSPSCAWLSWFSWTTLFSLGFWSTNATKDCQNFGMFA